VKHLSLAVFVTLISATASPAQPPSLEHLGTVTGGATVLSANNRVLLAATGSTLRVIDVTQPASAVTLATVEFEETILGLALTGNIAYIANSHEGLHRLDLSSPTAPRMTGHLSTRGQAVGVAAAGGYTFVADNSLGFDIVGTDGPLSRVGEYLSDGFPRGIAASDTFVFVADQPAGLIVVDVSNPDSPTVRGTLSLGPDPITQVFVPNTVSGTPTPAKTGALVSRRGGLQIVDLADPDTPRITAAVGTSGRPRAVTVTPDRLHAITGSQLETFDITTPTNPRAVGRTDIGSDAQQVVATPSLVFVGTTDEILILR
jgi:hypothetical protein